MSVSQQLAPAAGLSLSEPSQPSRCPSSRQQGPSPKPRSVPAHASNGAVQGAAPAAGGTTAQEHGSAGRGCLSPFGDARRPRPRGPAAADTQHMSLRANPGGAVQCSRGAPRCAGPGPAPRDWTASPLRLQPSRKKKVTGTQAWNSTGAPGPACHQSDGTAWWVWVGYKQHTVC